MSASSSIPSSAPFSPAVLAASLTADFFNELGSPWSINMNYSNNSKCELRVTFDLFSTSCAYFLWTSTNAVVQGQRASKDVLCKANGGQKSVNEYLKGRNVINVVLI